MMVLETIFGSPHFFPNPYNRYLNLSNRLVVKQFQINLMALLYEFIYDYLRQRKYYVCISEKNIMNPTIHFNLTNGLFL